MGESSQREQRILDAAAELITHYGYDKTTVEEIAREAGISKGAVYLHFKSKEALFEALLLRETDVVTERFLDMIEADPAGVTLFTLYRYALIVVDEAPLLKAIYTRDRRILGDWVRHLRDTSAYAQSMNLSVDFIRQMQKTGMLRDDLDPEMVAYLLRALRYGLLTMDDFSPTGKPPPPVTQVGDALAEMIANGLAPREGSATMSRELLTQMLDMQRKVIQERRAAKD